MHVCSMYGRGASRDDRQLTVTADEVSEPTRRERSDRLLRDAGLGNKVLACPLT